MTAVREEAPDLFAALESAGKVRTAAESSESLESPSGSPAMPQSSAPPAAARGSTASPSVSPARPPMLPGPPAMPSPTVPRKTMAMTKRMVIGGPPTSNPGMIDDLASLLESVQPSRQPPPAEDIGFETIEDQETNEVEEILDPDDLIEERETKEVDVVTDQNLSEVEEVLRRSALPGLVEAVDARRRGESPSRKASASVSASASFVDEKVRRSFPWAWLGLTVMLGGGLVYVLATETDLFEGDLVARRQAVAQAEVARAQAELDRKAAAEQPKYGTIQINSSPEGARVWLVRPGPKATFPNLPRDGEYHVVVFGDGFIPRTRVVKGSELDAPVILDLDPLPAEAAAVEFEDLGTPKIGSGSEVATLELRSNTPGAQLGLSLGWTPKVSVVDLDTAIPHRFLIDKAGHVHALVTVQPGDWQDGPDGDLMSVQTVTLEEARPVEETEGAEDEVLEIVDDEPEPAAQGPKKKKKRRPKSRRKSR